MCGGGGAVPSGNRRPLPPVRPVRLMEHRAGSGGTAGSQRRHGRSPDGASHAVQNAGSAGGNGQAEAGSVAGQRHGILQRPCFAGVCNRSAPRRSEGRTLRSSGGTVPPRCAGHRLRAVSGRAGPHGAGRACRVRRPQDAERGSTQGPSRRQGIQSAGRRGLRLP